MKSRALRRSFVSGLVTGLKVVWPILSGLLALIVALGVVAGILEGWSLQESVYFSFVTGLTIGYGDLAPKTFLARALAILIGVCGILLTALVAAVAVKALTAAADDAAPPRDDAAATRALATELQHGAAPGFDAPRDEVPCADHANPPDRQDRAR